MPLELYSLDIPSITELEKERLILHFSKLPNNTSFVKIVFRVYTNDRRTRGDTQR